MRSHDQFLSDNTVVGMYSLTLLLKYTNYYIMFVLKEGNQALHIDSNVRFEVVDQGIFEEKICRFFTVSRTIVRYHCGGWSEEVNSCILILSYMVYL
jgi:hypothetical protein